MGADQSLPANVKVKNTFIDIDIPRDTRTRLRRCLSGPNLGGSRNIDDDDFISSSLQRSRFSKLATNLCKEDHTDDNQLNDEMSFPQLCRYKTMDRLDGDVSHEQNTMGNFEQHANVYSINMQPFYAQPYQAGHMHMHADDAQKWNHAAVDTGSDSSEPHAWNGATVHGLGFMDVPDTMPVNWGIDMVSRQHISWADVADEPYVDRSGEDANTSFYSHGAINSQTVTGRYRWGRGDHLASDVSVQNQSYNGSASVEGSHAGHQTSENAKAEAWTTRMLRNLPNDMTRQDLLDLLDAHSILYEFIYLPIDWRKGANLGYAFVGLVSEAEAERTKAVLDGFADWMYCSEKKCEVVWGKPDQQGLHGNIERFRNSPVMHPDVPDECKPMLFQSGQRVPFPAPTRHVSLPRGFHRKVACQ